MIISVNWLKKYTDIDLPVDELATLIGERLVEIESVQSLAEKYKDVVVAKVVECADLEGSDHLHVTKIDDGGVVAAVDRDNNGYIQVVCGAPNVKEGLLVAWLPPETIVPETVNSAEPFMLGSRELRGVMSHGMLASAKELDLYDDHTGILEVDKDAAPGTSFAELYELDDYLLDIENKSLTHRPDTFGVIGFAREVAGIQGKLFKTPEWILDLNPSVRPSGSLVVPTIHIDDEQLSDRFQAIILSDISESAQSPVQMQTYLARSGVRPINALVDVSNYLMLLTGQPSHAYDYDKLKAVAGDEFSIHVRLANKDETLQLLDGKVATLDESDIVISAGETAVGLAGVMGGKSTAVDSGTKAVLLEVATFNLYNMRASQMRHGIFSEAVTRFTKGIPSALSAPVAAQAALMLSEHAKAVTASGIVEDYPGRYEPIEISVSERLINDTLGTVFAAGDIADLLINVGFGVKFDNLVARVTVPYWRNDIHLPEDIIEEVGRLAGFDTINLTLPSRRFEAIRPSKFDTFRSAIRSTLVGLGSNEVLTYSFVHGDLFNKVGQNPENAYKIVNSLSPELQYYRQSLTPSLVSHVFTNIKAGFDAFALFEINKVHQKDWGMTEEDVPVEQYRLALTLARSKAEGSAYYQAKALLDSMFDRIGVVPQYLTINPSAPIDAPFESKRSATILDSNSGAVLGVVGEYSKSVQKAFKLPDYSAGFELDMEALELAAGAVGLRYQKPSRFPGSERDICFQVQNEVPYATIQKSTEQFLATTGLIYKVSPVDIYQSEGSSEKNITIRVELTSYERTMTNDEVSGVVGDVINDVLKMTNGKVI